MNQNAAHAITLSTLLLDTGIALVSYAFMLNNAVFRVTRRLPVHPTAADHFIPSGTRTLHGVYVEPEDAQAAVLLCHGIGETVRYSAGVQNLLAQHGIASLVVNYSGFGRSTGRIRAAHCDEDLLVAWCHLQQLTRARWPISLLGYSMGTGIAAAGIARLDPTPRLLVLCESFDSFRNCARRIAPDWLVALIPDVWDTASNVRSLTTPLLLMHSDSDFLMPVAMAENIAAAASSPTELHIIPALSHPDPYLRLPMSYWQPVIEGLMARPK